MAEPTTRQAGLHISILLVVLTLGLVTATAASVVVAGIALGLAPAAVISIVQSGDLAARGLSATAALLGPVLTVWLLGRSWSAFARARAGRCADYMLAALVVALGLHALVFGAPVP